MEISYKVMVRPRLTPRRCLGDGQKILLKVVQWDHLRDPHGESEGKKGVKIGRVNTRKNSLALERGRSK